MKILGFQTDIWEPTRDDVYAMYDFSSSNKPKFLHTLTICYWIKHLQYTLMPTHVSISSSEDSNTLLLCEYIKKLLFLNLLPNLLGFRCKNIKSD